MIKYQAIDVDKIWETRPKSGIVKYLMKESHKTTTDIASALGISSAYLNNKFNRDSFSFTDFIIISMACGYHLMFVKDKFDLKYDIFGDIKALYIDKDSYFTCNKEVI